METNKLKPKKNKLDKFVLETLNFKYPLKITHTLGFRIMGIFIMITILVTVVFEGFYINSLHNYYYDNTSEMLLIQGKYNAELYLTYLSNEDLSEVVNENKNQFYRSNLAEVQILNNAGIVLYDSLGTDLIGKTLTTYDVISALDGEPGVYTGFVSYNKHRIMSISYPLSSQSKQIGVIRLTTSLEKVDAKIFNQISTSLIFCLFVIVASATASFLISRSIIHNVRDLTKVAMKLSDGQFKTKANEEAFGEFGELSKTLNTMSENIVKKEALKNEFISNVSHELRTPLTSIKGWAITLQADDIDYDLNQEGLKIIEKESERLSDMVEDLLDFSRFNSGKITMSKVAFNVIPIVQNIVSQFQPTTKKKNINMLVNFNRDPIIIVANEDRIKQLLLNIIDNAIKFTNEKGTIIVDLLLENKEFQVSVIDTGIGIPEDEITLVTEKFWKGTSKGSHTGLGLAICEEIAKAHGGKIKITSQVNKGTTVTVSFPAELA